MTRDVAPPSVFFLDGTSIGRAQNDVQFRSCPANIVERSPLSSHCVHSEANKAVDRLEVLDRQKASTLPISNISDSAVPKY